ncbi:hypothetical protein F964_00467 [Acinetobacter guillouiae NIPH 991]|uniref:Outer membrane porin, OprD family n=1 Tax=Acinetobacter guillouiae NIPH 991 TaxID=1217656 RepID=N8X2S2_ACIGI|nr:hypothetical protein F964_00467 [Acinetobacter guillouiae NIPH 991]
MLFNTPFTKIFTTLIFINTCAFTQLTLAKDEWKLTLKNAYIDRNFDQENVKDSGSWSQGVSLFYHSQFYDAPIEILNILCKLALMVQCNMRYV